MLDHTMINIAVVDDHQLFREGFSMLLKKSECINSVSQFSNGKEFVESNLVFNDLDIVFMDIDMPIMNGIDATVNIIARYPKIKIIALSMHNSTNNVNQMFNAGCKGYLVKNSSYQEIELAISRVLTGNTYTAQDLLNKIEAKRQYTCINDDFTPREKEIITQISLGKTSSQIAEYLNISKRTVDKHRENIHIKAGVNTSAELVHFCLKSNII